VARLQKVEKNLNETVATRGTVLATLRKQIKDSNALVLNSAQKVAAFWRAQIDTEKARLDHIYKHFVGASPSVLDGGDFPPVPVDVPVDNDDAVDDDDDDNDDDDDDSGSSADKELVVPSKASASSSLNQKQKAVSTSSTSSSKSAADDDAENDGDHKSHASPRADVAPTLSKTLRATSVKPISFPADIKSCESKLREIWSRPVGTGTTFKDLPRLAKRVSLSVDGTAVTLPATATESTVATLAELIRAIALRLEAADKAALVSAACDALSAQDQHETPELHVGKVFELLGATSATEAVFRSIHQGVILPAALWLKAHTRVLSKDVTSDDGWTIAIAIESATKRVTVSHVRQEQSLSAEPADRFTLAYRLRFVLVGAELELCDMRFVEADWRSKTLSADVRSALAALDAWNQAADQLHQQAQ
jgi:hypothetical protein